LPSSLSAVVPIDLLQKQLSYEGVVNNDDFAMSTIADHYTKGDTVAMAIKACNIKMLFSSDVGDVEILIETIAEN